MKRILMMLLPALFLCGCAITAEERSAREQALKASADEFIHRVMQEDWTGAFAMTEGGLEGAEALKENLKKTWVPDAVLTGGFISSMAWVSGDIAKIKVNWSFQAGTVPSYSSETFVWEWKNKTWKWKGRVLR